MNATLILQHFDCHVDQPFVEAWTGQGYSGSQIWKVIPHPGADHQYCLRAFPLGRQTPEKIAWRGLALQQAAALPFLQQPILTRHGLFAHPDERGRLWQLEPWARGRNDFLAAPSSQKLASAVDALAALHQIWSARQFLDSAQVPPESQPIGLVRRRQFAQQCLPLDGAAWQKMAQRAAQKGPHWAALFERVRNVARESLPPLAQELQAFGNQVVPAAIVLGDPWSDHLFFENHQLTGIIDYDAMRVDSIAADLSRLLCSLVGQDPHAQQIALDRYLQHRPLTDVERQVWQLTNRSSQVLGPILWMRWLFLEQSMAPAPILFQRIEALVDGRAF